MYKRSLRCLLLSGSIFFFVSACSQNKLKNNDSAATGEGETSGDQPGGETTSTAGEENSNSDQSETGTVGSTAGEGETSGDQPEAKTPTAGTSWWKDPLRSLLQLLPNNPATKTTGTPSTNVVSSDQPEAVPAEVSQRETLELNSDDAINAINDLSFG